MRKKITLMFSVLSLILGLGFGFFICDWVDDDCNNINQGKKRAEVFLQTDKYDISTDFSGDVGISTDIYEFSNNIIRSSFNSQDNYYNYKQYISQEDFSKLSPRNYFDYKNDISKPNADEYFYFHIYEIKYTDEKAVVSYYFDYNVYNSLEMNEKYYSLQLDKNCPMNIYLSYKNEV